MSNIPTLEDVREYLKVPEDEESDFTLQAAYDAQLSIQMRNLGVYNEETETWDSLSEENYPPELALSLYRRINRTLALKGVPLGIISGAGDGSVGVSRVSGTDREIQVLEVQFKLWHKLVR